MKSNITKLSTAVKFLPFLFLAVLLFSTISCSKSDSDDDNVIIPTGEKSFVSYSLSGPIINGDFKIEYIPSATDDSPGFALGVNAQYIEGEPQKSLVFYSDEEQDLSLNLIFLSKKGTFDLGEGEQDGSISLYHQNSGYLKSGSITISVIKYENFSIFSKLAVKGSFQGVLEHYDSGTESIVNHDISGNFEFDNY